MPGLCAAPSGAERSGVLAWKFLFVAYTHPTISPSILTSILLRHIVLPANSGTKGWMIDFTIYTLLGPKKMQNHARLVMKSATRQENVKPFPAGLAVRNISLTDAKTLGVLLYNAYKNTIDDDGSSPEEAAKEARETLNGKYGQVIWQASFVASDFHGLVCVSLVTEYEQLQPLLAFAATNPAFRGKGVASELIKRSLRALNSLGVPNLYLVVTEGNPAQRLYERLGFTLEKRREPGDTSGQLQHDLNSNTRKCTTDKPLYVG